VATPTWLVKPRHHHWHQILTRHLCRTDRFGLALFSRSFHVYFASCSCCIRQPPAG